MNSTSINRRFLRGKGCAVLFATLLSFYVLSYFVLSRTSIYILRSEGGDGSHFYYVPVDPRLLFEHDAFYYANAAAVVLFYPVWWVDRTFLSGPMWGYHMPMKDLGHSPEQGNAQ